MVACSGSDDKQPSAANIASVNAGADQTVREGQAFTLTASVYPEGGSISWSQTSGPAISAFPEITELSLELTTPSIHVDSELEFTAVYTAPNGQMVSDTVLVRVTNVNTPPIARAIIDETGLPPFNTYEIVTLSAKNSEDPDGEIRGYDWQQVDGLTPLKFTTDTKSSIVEFEAPFVSEITNYKIQLTVTDNFGATDSYIVDVQIASSQATLAANAGPDQTVDEFTQVILDGSDSVSSLSDVTCSWSQTSGTTVTLTNSNECKTDFIAPDVDSVDTLVFTLSVSDTGGSTASDTVNVIVNPLNLGKLHDTGVIACYDNSQIIDCGNSDFPKQDADMGRDAVRDVIDKSGSGEQAFDFTKFDVNGDEISNDALVFSCVRDNFTGLIWEVKEPKLIPNHMSLRAVENTYSFDDTLPPTTTCTSTEDCGVETFIEEVNEASYCGGKNWRLPTYVEMMAIMNYGDLDQDSLLDTEFFPHSPDPAELGHVFYWVSDASAEGGAEGFNWVIDMRTGDDAAILLGASAYVRLVRTP